MFVTICSETILFTVKATCSRMLKIARVDDILAMAITTSSVFKRNTFWLFGVIKKAMALANVRLHVNAE